MTTATKLTDVEMDRWTAMDVMEWIVKNPEDGYAFYSDGNKYGMNIFKGVVRRWNPTKDLNQAVQVFAEGIQKIGISPILAAMRQGHPDRTIPNPLEWVLLSDNPARAFCEAIYEAMKGEDDDGRKD